MIRISAANGYSRKNLQQISLVPLCFAVTGELSQFCRMRYTPQRQHTTVHACECALYIGMKCCVRMRSIFTRCLNYDVNLHHKDNLLQEVSVTMVYRKCVRLFFDG